MFFLRLLRRSLIAKLGLLVLFLLAGVVLYYALPVRSEVPDVVGENLETARGILSEAQLKVRVVRVYSPTQPKHKVIKQAPRPGASIKKETAVTLTVSRGKKALTASEEDAAEIPKRPEAPAFDEPQATDPRSAPVEAVVCIDPGHQNRANLEKEPLGPGSSTLKEKVRGGSTGVVSKTPEYRITLAVSLKLKTILESRGVNVVMVRETNDVNISNAERARVANQANAGLFVRIHADGNANPAVRGISTLYPANNQWTGPIFAESLRAAGIIQRELVKATGGKDNGLSRRNDITGFNWSEVPVVLPEVGFLSNAEDDRLLNTEAYQQKVAQGLAKGILLYLGRE